MTGKKNVLITGGLGFIGYHLSSELSKNYNIHLIDNLHRGKKDVHFKSLLKKENINFYNINILNEGSLNKIIKNNYHYIFHFASIVGVKNVKKTPIDVIEKNFMMSKNIFKFAKKQKNLKKIFFSSTSEIYAGSESHKLIQIPTKEESIISLPSLFEARTSYMLSKIYSEYLLIQSSLPYVIVRFHNIYGPRMGMSHVIPELIKKLNSKNLKKILIPNYSHTRSFCYIDDCISQIIKLMNTRKINLIINCGNNKEEISIYKLASKIKSLVKSKNKIVKGNLYKDSPSRRCPNLSKLRKIIYINKFTNLDIGLSKTFKWYLENNLI